MSTMLAHATSRSVCLTRADSSRQSKTDLACPPSQKASEDPNNLPVETQALTVWPKLLYTKPEPLLFSQVTLLSRYPSLIFAFVMESLEALITIKAVLTFVYLGHSFRFAMSRLTL